mgnify:CR=1 FL=1
MGMSGQVMTGGGGADEQGEPTCGDGDEQPGRPDVVVVRPGQAIAPLASDGRARHLPVRAGLCYLG